MALTLLGPFLNDKVKGRELLTSAVGYAEQMEMLITEFLEMNILHEEDIRIVYEVVPIESVVKEVLKDYGYVASQKNIAFDVDVDSTTHVYADRRRLKQVLANLVSNAVKYSPTAGTVCVQSHSQDGHLTLHVIDEGEGIPPDEIDLLFQPFGKLSTKPTGSEHSTGLGLWIVKEMIELQNGEAGLNTAYTDGADFWIRLPTAPQPVTTPSV
jgi:signal transduction histidine kinase